MTAPTLVRSSAVYVARCAKPGCPTQVRVTLSTQGGRPVMGSPLGNCWVPLMPATKQLRNAAADTHDWAWNLGMRNLGLFCETHDTLLWLREATGTLRPDTKCDSRCWTARHRVCVCQCGGRRHGEARDTLRA